MSERELGVLPPSFLDLYVKFLAEPPRKLARIPEAKAFLQEAEVFVSEIKKEKEGDHPLAVEFRRLLDDPPEEYVNWIKGKEEGSREEATQ